MKSLFALGLFIACTYSYSNGQNTNGTTMPTATEVEQIGASTTDSPLENQETTDETKCISGSVTLAGFYEALPMAFQEHPKSCADYNATLELVPISYMRESHMRDRRGGSEYDPRLFFRAGVDKGDRNMYICVATGLNGRILFGRGHINEQESRCWLDFGGFEVSVLRNVYWLRKPKNVKLVWKNGMEGMDLKNKAIRIGGDEDGKDWFVGRTTFQPLFVNPTSQTCALDQYTRELILPGYFNQATVGSAAKLRFTYGMNLWLASEFQILTCEDLNKE